MHNNAKNPNTFITRVNGPNELQKAIDSLTTILTGIKTEFERDTQQARAQVSKPKEFLGSCSFKVQMCEVNHESFVHSHTVLPQCSDFLKEDQNITELLNALESYRKMLKTFRQQGKTLRREVNRKKVTKLKDLPVDEPFECDLEGNDKHFVHLLDIIKQNHLANSRRIIEHANAILLKMRTQCILMYENTAQKTIQLIMNNADKCRLFIAQCRYIGFIEFCFSKWWMETQKNPDDDGEYYITAVDTEKEIEFNPCMSLKPLPDLSIDGNSKILIEVRSVPTRECSEKILFSEILNQELADTIFTNNSVIEFESGMIPTNYRYGTFSSKILATTQISHVWWS